MSDAVAITAKRVDVTSATRRSTHHRTLRVRSTWPAPNRSTPRNLGVGLGVGMGTSHDSHHGLGDDRRPRLLGRPCRYAIGPADAGLCAG